MKGSYLLGLYLEEDREMEIGALKRTLFKKGYYVYIGSAMAEKGPSSLFNRVKRHLKSTTEKKNHWHIDYFLSQGATIISISLIPLSLRMECELANQLQSISDGFIKDFGSSDCNCDSHLVFFKDGFPWG